MRITKDLFSMNRTLKLLIISDIFVFTGFGLIAPILAIFINDNLKGGSIFSAGLASTIFLLTHAVLQIYFSYKFNPKDRLWMLKYGTVIIALVPFGYVFSTSIYHIYLVEFVYGIGAAFAYPSWSSLFTAHLEKGKRGFQYSIYSSSVGIGTAITAGVGAWIAQHTSFQLVFILTGIIAVVGLLFLLKLEKRALKKI
jgi:MFS family permease